MSPKSPMKWSGSTKSGTGHRPLVLATKKFMAMSSQFILLSTYEWTSRMRSVLQV